MASDQQRKRYTLVGDPTRIPVPGGKLIEEYFGRVRTGTDAFSLAHMIAPPGWSEPVQTPRFGELTIMVRGSMHIEIGDESLELRAGQAIWVEPDVRVRYSNPYPVESEYFAICIPAFSPDDARRDPE